MLGPGEAAGSEAMEAAPQLSDTTQQAQGGQAEVTDVHVDSAHTGL